MNNQKRNLRIAIICGILLVLIVTGMLIINGFGVYDNHAELRVISYGFFILDLIIGLYFILNYANSKVVEKQLRQENLYNLGHANVIYNIHLFERRAHQLSFNPRLKKQSQFIISFTGGNRDVMSNAHKDDEVAAFNSNVADYMTYQFANRKTRFLKNEYIFCFDKGVFIVYAFVKHEDEVKQIIDKISGDLFHIQEEKGYRIWVQPFFGISQVKPGDNIYGAIDNSLLAREMSENNFETYTMYESSFRSGSSSYDDVNEIIKALENHEFVVYYQPKFSLKEKRFISSEALVRWNHPTLGLLGPAVFVEKAERGGLIHNIDTYVFERVCMDLNESKRRGRRLIPVSVNFSLYEFFSSSFLNSIIEMIDKYELPHNLIEIEITETTSQANQFLSISIIKKLRDQGIRVLMDDFGVGYSGIDSLRKIPFDAVKIDKSFTDLIVEDNKTRQIVKLLIELGHNSDIEVIVEGVDNKEQVDFLRKAKCDTIQGFYYSKALSKEDYENFLKDNPFENGGKK